MIDVNKINKLQEIILKDYGLNSSEYKLCKESYEEIINLIRAYLDLKYTNKNNIHFKSQKEKLNQIFKFKKQLKNG